MLLDSFKYDDGARESVAYLTDDYSFGVAVRPTGDMTDAYARVRSRVAELLVMVLP